MTQQTIQTMQEPERSSLTVHYDNVWLTVWFLYGCLYSLTRGYVWSVWFVTIKPLHEASKAMRPGEMLFAREPFANWRKPYRLLASS